MALHSDLIRGHLEGILLHLILQKDCYGYELASLIKERSQGRFEIKEATLYALVQRLEERGFIRSYIGDKSHGRKRRYYTMTPAGKAYYAVKKAEWLELQSIMSILWEEKNERT